MSSQEPVLKQIQLIKDHYEPRHHSFVEVGLDVQPARSICEHLSGCLCTTSEACRARRSFSSRTLSQCVVRLVCQNTILLITLSAVGKDVRQAVRATAELQASVRSWKHCDHEMQSGSGTEARETGELPSWPQVLGDTLLLLLLPELQSLIDIHGGSCQADAVAARVPLLCNAAFSQGLSIESKCALCCMSWLLPIAQSWLPKVAAVEAVSFGSCQGPGGRIRKVGSPNRKGCLASTGSLDAFRRWATTGCPDQRDAVETAATVFGFTRSTPCEVPISELSAFSDGSLKSC